MTLIVLTSCIYMRGISCLSFSLFDIKNLLAFVWAFVVLKVSGLKVCVTPQVIICNPTCTWVLNVGQCSMHIISSEARG
jgi:hypothetical protein